MEDKIYTAKEINEYMGYVDKAQSNNGKSQFLMRCKNAGLELEDIPVKRGLPNKYKIKKDNFYIEGEKWVQCYCYDEWEVSSEGRIRRKSTKKLLGSVGADGYKCVTGRVDNKSKRFLVHRLVYFSFNKELIELEKTLCIDHINGIRTDNSLNNLRAVTQRKNTELREVNNKTIQTLTAQLITKYGYETTIKKLEELL